MLPIHEAIVAALASFLLISVVLACIIIICKKMRKPDRTITRQLQARPGNVHNSELSSITVDESASFDPLLHRISMAELAALTKNFSPDYIIGDGSFGLVYRAQLSNGVKVAIKKLDLDAFQGLREFRAEMDTLGKLRHRHIVKILGYCVSGEDRVLIYEYKEKGSLDQWLYDMSDTSEELASRIPLSWDVRVKVIRDVADGLCYLHGLETPIIHRDIKASNVLLDFDFEAYIADFGLARTVDSKHSHVSTQVAGTMGYMPPEYKEGLTAATVKQDVYSFGTLMFEIATANRPSWPLRFDNKEMGMVEWARRMVEGNRHMDLIDPSVSKEGLDEAMVKAYFGIACSCTSENAKERPVMHEVFYLLDQIYHHNTRIVESLAMATPFQ